MKETGSAASLKAAQEAAAKVNAMLVASGQLKLSELSKNRTKNNKSNDLFIEEVNINDAPMSARNFLTRSSTQEEISKMSGAAVSTRGRYMNQEERKSPSKNPSDRPLYLHIQAVNQQDVKVAVGRITHIIMEHSHRKGHNMQRPRGPRPNPAPGLMGPRPGSGPRGPRPLAFRPPQPDVTAPPPPSQPQPPPPPPPPVTNIFREKVFLPVNIGLNPADIQARLVGESGMNLRYIQEETGVAISIRGIGSGYHENGTGQEAQDPLHFYLEHDNQDQFNQAKDLVVNLAQTVISEVQQEMQQQQQQQQQQHHQQLQHQQLQQPAPLFTQPPPPQPDVALGGGGSLGQAPLAPVQVAPHQLAAPPAPPPQMVHSQMAPPQVPPHTQIVPPHVGHPQMPPAQVPLQGQVGGPQVNANVMHTVLAPHLQPAGAPVSQEVMPQQEVIQATVVSLPQQVVHLTAPPVVSSTAAVANQQLVHTSSGTQLVTLPPGTQIINMPDGPRLVALAGGTQVAPPPGAAGGHQTHPAAPLHDPQGVVNPMVQQQTVVPHSMAVSGATNHMTINQPAAAILTDGAPPPPPSNLPRSMGATSSYSAPSIVNTVNTSSPLTNAPPHGGPEASFPPNINASIPPPSMPPPAALGLPPAVTAHAGTVSFVLTPGVNTMTTTSGVGLLVPQDPSGQMHATQPVVVTGVMPSLQQQQPQQQPQPHHHHHHHPHPHPHPHPVSQTGSAYLASDPGYTGPPITSNATQHYTQMPPQQQQQQHQQQQQQQRPLGVAYAPVGLTTAEGAAHGRIEFQTGGVPGVMASPVPLNNLPPRHQKHEQQQQQPLHAPSSHYGTQPNQQPVLEQQWQQFQQQVKMEGGQQQYDPYAAATEESEHQDTARHTQTTHSGVPTSQQQTTLSTQAPSQSPAQVTSQQQYASLIEQSNQQQHQQSLPQQASSIPVDTKETDNRSLSTIAKGEGKAINRGSPHSSHTHYYTGQQQTLQGHHAEPPPSPDRQDHHAQPRYSTQQQGLTHTEQSQQQQQRRSPQTQPQSPSNHPHHQQQQFQIQFQEVPAQKTPEMVTQEDQYQYQHGPTHPPQGPPQPGGLPEGHYQQGPPQYPWAQYPQPTSGPAPYHNGSAPFTTPAGPYERAEGAGPFPGTPEDQQQHGILQEKKPEPGVARDMTASLLMPPPPPPPNETVLGSRVREDPSEPSMKRLRSYSPQDERRLSRRHGTDPGTFRAGTGGYTEGGRGGRFPSGPGSFMEGGDPWEWRQQLAGPYSDLTMRAAGPFNRPSGCGPSNSQAPYPRNPRGDRTDLEDWTGSNRRVGRGGGGRGGFSIGGRGGRDRRW